MSEDNKLMKQVWIRDILGNIKCFETVKKCAAYCGCTKQSVFNAVNKKKGNLILKYWQASYNPNDWSHCCNFNENQANPHHGTSKENVEMANLNRIVSEHNFVPEVDVEPVKEPRTQKDWDEMRQRALQPFVCSITDDDIKRHEEKMRKMSISEMKKTKY